MADPVPAPPPSPPYRRRRHGRRTAAWLATAQLRLLRDVDQTFDAPKATTYYWDSCAVRHRSSHAPAHIQSSAATELCDLNSTVTNMQHETRTMLSCRA